MDLILNQEHARLNQSEERIAPGPKRATAQENGCEKPSQSSTQPSPRHNSPTARESCEPKQPGNIQDLLEYRLDMATKPANSSASNTSSPSNGLTLTKNDVKALLSGAPHFLLEKGKHRRWYPQVIFPWDEQNPVIQHMWDRKPLPHASFTLSTLHAHLPVPDDWAVKGGVPLGVSDWRRTGATNRATFDIDIFEVPNMLSNNGKEPGTVGFRHFLELPVADAVRFTGPEEPKKPEYMRHISTMGASEAFDLMEGYNKPYSQCQSGAVFDRHRLISEGPEAWKRIGVRDINLRSVVQRLNHLRQFRKDLLREGTKTILDIESPRQLHDSLHTQFLHPRPPPADVLVGHPESVKSQIKTLAIVLATPGAWINFSLPEWRFRAGQVLWEASQHRDGDCLMPEPGNISARGDELVKSGIERKWLLIQLLLSAELLLRLDAFVRVDMLHNPKGGNITIPELRQFDKLREGKLNWDLVVVRRFLDSLNISCASPRSEPCSNESLSRSSSNKWSDKSHRFPFLDTLTRRSSSPVSDLPSAWDCQLSSSHVRQQLAGLFVFAENIGWPRLAALEAVMKFKLGDPENPILPAVVLDDTWGRENGSKDISLGKADMYTRSSSRRRVRLHGFSDSQSKTLGWISRTWLSGFVIPGESISHLLMATILENDIEALELLGPTASLYGGFVLGERSWWSKACIVGRVLSSSIGAQTCMGWIGSDILPRDAITLAKFEPGWIELAVEEVEQGSSRPRIKHGARLALESSPLGIADITAAAFTLPRDPKSLSAYTVAVESLTLSISDCPGPSKEKGIKVASEASISFSIEGGELRPLNTVCFPLKYNVRFISAHECHPPSGVASRDQGDNEPESQESERCQSKYTRLTGHPLHRSYPYKYVPLDALSTTSAPQKAPQDSEADLPSEIMVIDARGHRDRETLVRAWCASVGCHAIIGRSGRACVACCIRQARAVDVQVVIRVGD